MLETWEQYLHDSLSIKFLLILKLFGVLYSVSKRICVCWWESCGLNYLPLHKVDAPET